ncbi:gustatory receptor for sugar taste 64f-like [Sitodiplosis mosellana]|uniref:gustatory receptor for sugar taste 64f-like n=1 Tax=Sitodiplosis mosellana TaxID=263140 RepID=UPI0024450DA9|nr:gustatory receptor for sugar taste 64f-like [Sitodiplosis mosellana]
MSQEYWAYRREQYRRLCDLVDTFDEKISHFVLLCYWNHLFFICKQLFLNLRPQPTYYRMIYFWYSFIFLMMRAFFVSFTAAGINDESTKPIDILRSMSSYSWNIEARRFFDDVTNETIALSGMRFFFITRKMILSVIGTIVTYEIIMMQFHSSNSYVAVCQS